ncbi:MAG: TetR/AcrR family transcriptional regulator [Bacteroidales bacterium]|nr:TetR/AcrR family transcriptional regulator [Bacteroidales bacterium]
MFSERQQQIIDSSIILIDRLGIQGFTIKNLAKEIGISEPAIYRHFDSKVDILSALLDSFKLKISNYHTLQAETSDSVTGEERLKHFFSMIFTFFSENPTFVSVIFAEEIFQNEKRLSEKVMKIQELNELAINRMMGPIPLSSKMSGTPNDFLSIMFLGPVRLLVRQWKIKGYAFDLKKKGVALIDTILRSLQE